VPGLSCDEAKCPVECNRLPFGGNLACRASRGMSVRGERRALAVIIARALETPHHVSPREFP